MRALPLTRSPFAILALWILLAITPRASEARMAPGDLADIFDRADAVVLATVVSSEMHEWDRSYRETGVCGYTVKIRIKESYSGGYNGEIKIGSSTSLVPDGTYLLFLNRRSVFVGTDVVHQYGESAEARKSKCLSKTPQLKANWRFTTEVAGKYGDYALIPSLIRLPEEIDSQVTLVKRDWMVEKEGLSEEVCVDATFNREACERWEELFYAVCHHNIWQCREVRLLPIPALHEWLWQYTATKRPEPIGECLLKGFYRIDVEQTLLEFRKYFEDAPPDDLSELERHTWLQDSLGSTVLEWNCNELRLWHMTSYQTSPMSLWYPVELAYQDDEVLKVSFTTFALPDYTIRLENECMRVRTEWKKYEEVYCPMDEPPVLDP